MESISTKNVKDFSLCQTANSTNLKPKIARILDIPQIRCHNHSFSAPQEDIEKASSSLVDAIENAQSMHCKVKKINILSAGLANYQEAAGKMGKKVKLQAETRWISIAEFLKSRLDCVEDLRDVAHKFPTKLDESKLCKDNL